MCSHVSVFARWSTIQITASLLAAALRSARDEMAALQSLLGDQFLFSTQRQRQNPTSSIPKLNKNKKAKEIEKQTPETAALSISYLMPCGVSPSAEKQLLFLLERRITTSLK